jgi:hypothetical protein
MFSGKNPNGNAENEISMACYTPIALCDEISCCTISL